LLHLIAVASTTSVGAWWVYTLLFLAVMASWAGVPMVGSVALAAGAAAASQGNLNLPLVVVISAVAGEVGGLLGYYIGHRWGTQLLARPGKHQARRQRLMDKGELAYAKWGRMAVFFIPAIISGTAKMKLSQFALWNLFASILFTLSVTATAYGLGRVATGHRSAKDILILLFGLALSTLLTVLVVRRHRRHQSQLELNGLAD
jgi:membrane protein DedA with SNARE-associated domain